MTDGDKQDVPRPSTDPAAGPTFDVPTHLGEPAALETLASVASPLLAGGTLALLGVVVQQPTSLRWPGLALALLAAAAVLLVTAVQCGFWARRHLVRPDELAAWWPTMPAERRWQRVRAEQWAEQARYRIWADRCRTAYGAGIAVLWLGAAIALLPTTPMSAARWVAVAVALAASASEIAWFLGAHAGPRHRLHRIASLRALHRWLDPHPSVRPPPELWPWRPDGEAATEIDAGATGDPPADPGPKPGAPPMRRHRPDR